MIITFATKRTKTVFYLPKVRISKNEIFYNCKAREKAYFVFPWYKLIIVCDYCDVTLDV